MTAALVERMAPEELWTLFQRVVPGSDNPPQGEVLQGTVAVTGTGTPDIIMIQLVTASVELADDYRDILLGVAHTVTFTDPSLPEAGGNEDLAPGSVVASMRNDFG